MFADRKAYKSAVAVAAIPVLPFFWELLCQSIERVGLLTLFRQYKAHFVIFIQRCPVRSLHVAVSALTA